ncbi:hypothetical protein [Leptospira stimsonii]|uniref:DUF4178 domain-containing protein n=1 Tax=Leptospira stimsonii TaxID=2202203 RepID=A0ABY2MWN3_9LEPT|nr:hypothetical protein [Leptospira stimsonii]TGK12948.1 hypothetical protein EHO98_19215 [Leptospira stimsonii]TGM10126.1 hypothetical protein EHQ90_19530 [Leptospira stimsonii]
MINRILIILAVCYAQIGFAQDLPLTVEKYKIHIRGVGKILIGMSVVEIEKVTGQKLKLEEDPLVEQNCTFYYFKNSTSNLGFMFTGPAKNNMKLARIYLYKPENETISGIKIGDSLAKLKSVYKEKLEETRGHYTNYLEYTYKPVDKSDKNYGIIFETDNKNITSISVGRYPELNLVEGCL